MLIPLGIHAFVPDRVYFLCYVYNLYFRGGDGWRWKIALFQARAHTPPPGSSIGGNSFPRSPVLGFPDFLSTAPSWEQRSSFPNKKRLQVLLLLSWFWCHKIVMNAVQWVRIPLLVFTARLWHASRPGNSVALLTAFFLSLISSVLREAPSV